MKMAEAKSAYTEEDLLQCSICNHEYKDPKQLPCLHSFCFDCLRSYISPSLSASNFVNGKNQVFCEEPLPNNFQSPSQTNGINVQRYGTNELTMLHRCPVCNTHISIDSSFTPLQYIQELPSNNVLLMRIQEEQINKLHPYCDLCIKSEDKTKTNFWCFDCKIALCNMCEHYHNRFPTLENHRIVQLDVSEASRHVPTLDVFCEDHNGEKVELFCFIHHYPCCNRCVESNHNMCQNITPISVAAKNANETEKICDLSNDADNLISRYEKLICDKVENITSLQNQHVAIEGQIVQFGSSIIDHFNTLIQNMMQQSSTLHTKTISGLEHEITDTDNTLKQLMNCKAIIHACSKTPSSVQIMQQLERVNNFLNKKDVSLKEQQEKEPCVEYKFKYNITLEEIKDNNHRIGSVKVVKKKYVSEIPTKKRLKRIQDIPLFPGTSNESDDVDPVSKSWKKKGGKVTHKKDRIFIKGIAIHPSGSILIINNYDCNLYIYDSTGASQTHMRISGESSSKPFDIAILDDASIAISLPQTCEIVRLNIKNMSKKEWLKTQDKCYGLFCTGRKLFSSCIRCIEIFNIDSEMSTTIPKLRYANGYLYVTPDLEKIFYTADSHLVCVSMDGKELHRNSEHKCLSGITNGRDDCIYVTDDEEKTLGRYTKTLEKVQKIPLPFIPSTVDTSDTSGRFFVCHQQQSEGYKNVRDTNAVSVFELL